MNGSSPRVRGTAANLRGDPQCGRFIPACAGNRDSPACAASDRPVHPRVCGEQMHRRPVIRSVHGSSPRVRGTASSRLARITRKRFIPACAGNSVRSVDAHDSATVHPRVCGEQHVERGSQQGKPGSSPRVRGTDQSHTRWTCSTRFIPACAGNRNVSRDSDSRRTVHPRVCGEQISHCDFGIQMSGSSPRVRGTETYLVIQTRDERFIPACAGNRFRTAISGSRCPVHPRVCGEQPEMRVIPPGQRGSSPRVRGTGTVQHYFTAHQRFIPACAGNRNLNTRSTTRATVHPRVCGEQN